jgi:site-specific recombinase XerD
VVRESRQQGDLPRYETALKDFTRITGIERPEEFRRGFKIGAHSLRATAATNALDHHVDIAKAQEWLGHANISTTRIYHHRKTRPGGQPDV